MNDVRMLLSVFLTFALFGAIVSFVPSELYPVNSYTYNPITPAYYEGLDISGYSAIINFTIDDGTFPLSVLFVGIREYAFELGGVYWVMQVDTGYNQIVFGERNYFGIIWMGNDYFQFKTELINREIVLHGSELNMDYTGNETWVSYRMYSPIKPDKGCTINFGFNTSDYSSPYEALLNQELMVYIGMGMDDVATTISAWQLVASFFIFNPPGIHPLVNGMIKIVTWSIMGVALVLFIGRFIPLIQGGS